ncbi:ArsR/SmtB family transcription factor, partial [Acinetobacter baumannii]|nr:transcriptional regulator [Acinetobacter baumannii]
SIKDDKMHSILNMLYQLYCIE